MWMLKGGGMLVLGMGYLLARKEGKGRELPMDVFEIVAKVGGGVDFIVEELVEYLVIFTNWGW